MSGDYISRENAINIVCDACNDVFGDEPCEPSDCEILLALKEYPAADVVEREHGEWEWHPYSADWACICCDHHSMEHTNFCPNCGADMRGES